MASSPETTGLVKRLREGRTDGTSLRWAVTPIHKEDADEIVRLRSEVASLRLTLGGRTFSGQPVPDPIGCPMPGACAQVAEIKRLRRGWLRVIQHENQCPATGGGCLSKRCGCVEEMEVLANEQG
jgi:hypothetical protein